MNLSKGRNRGSVVISHKQRSQRHDSGFWMTYLSALPLLIVCLIIAEFYESLMPFALVTAAVFWGVATTFQQRWSRIRFWLVLFFLLIPHVSILWMLARLHIILNFQKAALLAVVEGMIMVLVVAFVFGGKQFYKELQ